MRNHLGAILLEELMAYYVFDVDPLYRVLIKTAINQIYYNWIQPFYSHQIRIIRLQIDTVEDDISEIFLFLYLKRIGAYQKLINHNSHSPYIHFLIVLVPHNQFWAQIKRSPTESCSHLTTLEDRPTEIAQLNCFLSYN